MASINDLRNNKYVKEKNLGNGIHSFNFTSKCFNKAAWDSTNIKARGLFIDIDNNEVVARSYDKFFAFGERPNTQISYWAAHAAYPLAMYVKYNGFLGILSAGKDGHFFVASKSTNQGEFAGYFKNILERHFEKNDVDTNDLFDFLKTNNCSMVFEVIDVENDPHIVEYQYDNIVLLDIIYNNLDECLKMPYYFLCQIAEQYKFSHKMLYQNIKTSDDLYDALDYANALDDIEGFVIEDAAGNMVKYKTPWYKYWKRIRGIISQLNAGKQPEDIKNMYIGGRKLGDCIYNTWLDFKNIYGRVPKSIIEFRDFSDIDANGYLVV